MYVYAGMDYATRRSGEKPVSHSAVIDWIDSLGLCGGGRPVIIELVPGGPRARPFDPRERWQRQPIADLAGARRRLWHVLQSAERRRYHAVFNNCEHFARFIAFGEFRSDQVRGAVTIGLFAAVLYAASTKPRRRRRVAA